MIKKLSKLLIGLVVATPVWANNAQDYDQRYIQWKNKQHAVFQNQAQSSSSTSKTNKVSLNQASATELQDKLNGIGEKKAQAIVEYREKNGKFKSIDELKNVKGIGDKLLEKNRSNLAL